MAKFNPFVVLFGGENFFLDKDVAKVRQGSRQVIYLDADDDPISDSQLVEICQSYYDGPRTVVIDNAQKVKGNKALKGYIEGRDPADHSVILIAVVRSEKLSEVWSAARSKGKGVERKKIKPWEEAKYLDFLRSEASKNEVMLGNDVAPILLSYVGTDLYRLENELRKLARYVGSGNTIKKEHIGLITSPTPKAEPFQVAEAAMQKDVKKAMGLFSVLYLNSGEKGLVPVVGALMRQLEKTSIIRSLQDKGTNAEDIAVLLGMKAWPYKNVAAPIAQKHSLPSLISNMRRVCKLDADVKGPSKSKRTLVEMAILTIAQ
jgi:DNA polymerase-3 subunit delta